MKIKIDQNNFWLLVPLTGFAVGTLYIGSSYGPVSRSPFWASVFMLMTCLFVIVGLDNPADDGDAEKANQPGIKSV